MVFRCTTNIIILWHFDGIWQVRLSRKLNLSSYYFIKKHLLVVPLGMIMIFFISLLSPKNVRRIAAGWITDRLILLGFTLIFGGEIKGARRWLSLGGFSFQASSLLNRFSQL